ncbi:hypothetical protein A3K73_07390 [Candidatus Pacearchaeota archaeon RBG_13_36_9]|nr:MAG: hypothetical protein A3K73_07390 [Candidatus Pacearchaeota archaeon RBG_13_36_9]
MEITKTLYVTNRKDWRSWLVENYNKEKEIWLIYYKKSSGKPRISYNDAVEEALCYGWIDSTVKKIDEEKFAQRFSPRNKGSQLSEMNRQRLCKLILEKKMTKAGLDAVSHVFNSEEEKFIMSEKSDFSEHPKNERRKRIVFLMSEDMLEAIKKDKQAWKNFQNLPESYKRIRIAYIEHSRKRGEKEFKKRLNNFIKLTAKNKKFGFVKEMR